MKMLQIIRCAPSKNIQTHCKRMVAEEINSLKGMLCLSFPSNQQNVSAVKGGKRCRKSSVRLILSSHQHPNIAFACLPPKSI